MRQFHVIANWKMQLDVRQSQHVARDVVRLWAAQAVSKPHVKTVICPTHVALEEVRAEIKGTAVNLGAQDCFWEDRGAYTGEVSALSLKEGGCTYCIVGHSERREHLGETDEMVRRKTIALLSHGLVPIICVGETKEERRNGKRDVVVLEQVKTALRGCRPVGTQQVIVAYEPRWVIGTGQAVAPEDAASMHRLIIDALHEIYPADVVDRQFSVIYGGSVNPSNLGDYLDVPEIAGALVGGASLKADEFVKLAEIAADVADYEAGLA
jgi:triosephosphate isomerase